MDIGYRRQQRMKSSARAILKTELGIFMEKIHQLCKQKLVKNVDNLCLISIICPSWCKMFE
jgi:iron only hydrogenase large subunit-like protein